MGGLKIMTRQALQEVEGLNKKDVLLPEDVKKRPANLHRWVEIELILAICGASHFLNRILLILFFSLQDLPLHTSSPPNHPCTDLKCQPEYLLFIMNMKICFREKFHDFVFYLIRELGTFCSPLLTSCHPRNQPSWITKKVKSNHQIEISSST